MSKDDTAPAEPMAADFMPTSPIQPVRLGLDDTIQFQCRKGIACFNQCCQAIDITLTPYDILRLKRRLGLSSQDFLAQYTVPFELEAGGLPGVKLRTRDDSPACQFVTDEGCSVYEDRPTACRYYALGMMAMRRTGSPTDEESYFLVKEAHCLGHQEPRTLTVRDYRREQGVEEYDELTREWRQLVLKKRSAGPAVGTPSDRSLQLFFLASYNLDAFREFVASPSFLEVYEVPAETTARIAADDIELMKFGFRFLKQALFGEKFLAERPDAYEKRLARKREREQKVLNQDVSTGGE